MSILWSPKEAAVVEKIALPVITSGTQDMGGGIYWLKAGTPLDEDLAVSNDGDAKYIVAEDFYFVSTNPGQERMIPVITAGYVDINKAQAAAGITYSDDAKAALATAGVVLVDGTLPSSGGGSSLEIIHATVGEPVEGQESQYHLIIEETAEQILTMEAPVIVVDATTINFGKLVTSESASSIDADGSGEIDFVCNMGVYFAIGFSSGEISGAMMGSSSAEP